MSVRLVICFLHNDISRDYQNLYILIFRVITMAFEQKYTKDDVLAVMSTNTPKTITLITGDLGCVRNTALKFLRELEKEGKVKQVEVAGGTNRAWVKVQGKEIEGYIDQEGCLRVDQEYAGKKFKITILD